MRTRMWVVALVVIVAVIAIVGGWIVFRDSLSARPPAEVANPEPMVDDALIDPDQLRVDPQVAAPGDLVELYFPAATSRGVLFVLERRLDVGWHHEWWMLTSEDPDGRGPSSYPGTTEEPR